MRLRLKELRDEAKKVIEENKIHVALRQEFVKALGPAVDVPGPIQIVARAVNEHIDNLTRADRVVPVVRSRVLEAASRHPSRDVRKAVARLLSESSIEHFLDDDDSSVRCAAARRLPLKTVVEAAKRHRGDDQLRTILEARKKKEEVNPYRQRLGDEMSDDWYERTASDLCKIYGSNLEGQWEETLATRVAASHFSSTGDKIDREKLLKAIYDCLEERDERIMGEGSLRSITMRLKRESLLEEAAAFPIVPLEEDASSLLARGKSDTDFIREVEEKFKVASSTIPPGIRKHRLGESNAKTHRVPVKATIPGGRLTAVVESVLDRYVDRWNSRQATSGEPFRLAWSPGAYAGTVTFEVTLR